MQKFLTIGFYLLLMVPPAFGQVAFDSASSASGLSVSHTRGAVSNPYALACVTTRNNSDDITAVSYGGIAMAPLAETTAANQRAELWGLANPASGAQNVIAVGGGTDNSIIAATFGGVHQTVSTGTAQVVNDGAGTSKSLNVTVSANGLAADCLGHAVVETLNQGAGQTERAEQATGASSSALSTEGGSGTVAMSYSWTTETYVAYIAVPLEPATAAGAAVKVKTIVVD